jgi:hypothetical protein
LNKRIAWRPLGVITFIAEQIKHQGFMLNERYLHHYFSRCIPRNGYLNLADNGDILVHPEWPTYKKQTDLTYSRYKRVQGKYRPHPEGTAGFIDFGIGLYHKPLDGIEFTLKYGWSHEEVVYDFLKLMDAKNPFTTGISYNVIFRKRRLSRGKRLLRFERRMNEVVTEAKTRLQDQECGEDRRLFFMISEIDVHNARRHWSYDRKSNQFVRGLPSI